MGRDRALGILFALALHAAVVALALRMTPHSPAPPPPKPSEPPFLIHAWRAASVPKDAPARHAPHPPPAAVQIAEREIIDRGNGVTMTIEGGPAGPVDAGVTPPEVPIVPPHAAERWLRAEVWVPAGPDVAPHPGDYCTPRKPEMPEFAVERSITGRVEVSYIVDSQGVVSSVTQENAAPVVLSRAVRGWLTGCLFEPARESGRRVPARVKQTFVFKIQ